jgi:MFS family permease
MSTAGIIAVVYGVVADITGLFERGGFVGIVSLGTNTAPALGPLLGASLLAFRGWTSIFWFLSITAGVCLVMVIFGLPETARNVVGNRSIPASSIHRLPFTRKISVSEHPGTATRRNWRFPNPLTCLYLFRDKDNAILILTLSIFYMTYTCLQASLSSLFISLYGFNQLQAGLIYLPFGCGCALAAYGTGMCSSKSLAL